MVGPNSPVAVEARPVGIRRPLVPVLTNLNRETWVRMRVRRRVRVRVNDRAMIRVRVRFRVRVRVRAGGILAVSRLQGILTGGLQA